jgi:hypothetical protein
MKLELCTKIHNNSIKKSFALMCGLCTLRIYLPEADYEALKKEVKGMSWWNIYEDKIECRRNSSLDEELRKALDPKPAWADYKEKYPPFEVYCDKSAVKIHTNY